MRIALSQIAFDAGTQIRESINEQVVAEYAERMSDGVVFPPIALFHDGNRHYLGDGFHRFMAAQRNGFIDIDANVTAGTKEDALWFALGANKANGHRMTERDKRHALTLAFRSWPDKSARQVAEQIGCSSTYASRIRDEVQTGLQPVARVTGADGRSYPASKEARDVTRQDAEAMLREGKSIDEVRKVTGIGRDAAQQLRREVGVGGPDKSKAAVAQRRKDLRDLAERGYTSRQIASILDISQETVSGIAKDEEIVIHADRVAGRTVRHDSNRIVSQMVMDAENLTADVNLIDFSALDRAQIAGWLGSLHASRDKFGAFIRRLMKEQQKHGEAA